jgi:hypothetical protein
MTIKELNRRMAGLACEHHWCKYPYHTPTTAGWICMDLNLRAIPEKYRNAAFREGYRRAVRRGWKRFCIQWALVLGTMTAQVAGFFLCEALFRVPLTDSDEWDDLPSADWSETLPSGMPAPGAGT